MKEHMDIKPSEASAAVLPSERLDAENSRLGDYWELTKPRLTFLVLVTTLVGFCMGSGSPINWWLFAHAMLGTALVAGGAAVLNQYLERDADARMKRTQDRPLPAGRLSPGDALVYGAGLSVAGLLYLVWRVNLLTSFLAAFTLSSYLFAYTPLKRRTPLCTLVGAVPGAIPPMMGWSAVNDSLATGAWILFAILFLWQMPHFYALAQVYREDYARGGFPMLSVVDPEGKRTSLEIIAYTLALVPVSLAPTFIGLTGSWYLVGAVLLGLGFVAFGLASARRRSIESSRRVFLASIFYLPFILILMVADKSPL